MDVNEKENEEEVDADRALGETIISWEESEYIHYEKGVDWYWWAGLLAVILLGFAVWQHSFLFGVLVTIGWVTVVLYAVRPPRNILFALTNRGVLIDDTLYPWSELKSFWIFYNPVRHELSLESKKILMPYMKIPLGGNDPEKIKDIVSKFLPEVEQSESLIDNLSHLARF